MSTTVGEVISAFGSVLNLFTTPPLSYVVALMIVGSVGGLVARIIRRR